MSGSVQDRAERRVLAARIDRICDAFEATWRAGQSARCEDFLADITGAEREALLAELLATELELRRSAGQSINAEDYLRRFPELSHLIRAAVAGAETLVSSAAAADPAQTWDQSAPEKSPLALCPLFSAVPQQVLAAHVSEQMFEPGELLLRQGDVGESLLVIAAGEVEIRSTAADGSRRWIDKARRGDVLGEMALLTSEPRTADAIAIDHVRALVLPAERFHALARQYPELSVVLTELVARRLGKRDRDALTDKVLDRYRITGRLGRGGMGIVYRAEDLADGRTIALKMMSHKLVYHEDALQSFHREAEIIQSLHHPGIVEMYGRFAAFHTYFLVLEYCPGRTLDEVLADKGTLPEAPVRSILGQLAAALSCAHQAGVIHRDIKPANIMLTEEGRVKLMDFGLAEPVSAAGELAGRVIGTPRYMAPEQRRGQGLGRETDYFAFGCVAYELLAGQPLFEGETIDELARDFHSWQPPDMRELCPNLSDEMISLIVVALQADPRDRNVDLVQIANWSTR